MHLWNAKNIFCITSRRFRNFSYFFLPTINTLLNLKNDYFSQKKKKEVTFIYNLSIKAYFYFT